MPDSPIPALIVVPVKDEAERIGACLRALASQAGARPQGIVLAINNTTDGTADVVRSLAPGLPVPVHVLEHWFPPGEASAGSARRLGMEHAAGLLGEGGVLLTTDADGRVSPDWLAANLWHVRAGVEAVAGRAVLDPAEAASIPDRLHQDDARECAYAAALDEVAALLDPEPWDPWPRHSEHSGASIAVTLPVYRRVGGMPAVPLAEDRRFFEELRRVDARIRHAPEVLVTVSGRTLGRAEGGMADTIRRRLAAPDPYLDGALEPVATLARRAAACALFRLVHAGAPEGAELSRLLAVPRATVERAAAHAWCGEGWAWLQAESPLLRRREVPVSGLPAMMAEAVRLRASLRAAPGGQAGIQDVSRTLSAVPLS